MAVPGTPDAPTVVARPERADVTWAVPAGDAPTGYDVQFAFPVTVPAQPATPPLTVTRASSSKGAVDTFASEPADPVDDGGSDIIQYEWRVEGAASSTGPWSVVIETVISTTQALSESISVNLRDWYRVRYHAVNAVGAGPVSNWSAATQPASSLRSGEVGFTERGEPIVSINPDRPAELQPTEYLGTLPDEIHTPDGITHSDNGWRLLDSHNRTIWRLDLDNLDHSTKIGRLPAKLQAPRGLGHGSGRWLTIDDDNSVWKVNINQPRLTRRVGQLPAELAAPSRFGYADDQWFVIDDTDNSLWKINPDQPDHVGDGYGRLAVLGNDFNPAARLALGDGMWVLVDKTDNTVWNVDPNNPDNERGIHWECR